MKLLKDVLKQTAETQLRSDYTIFISGIIMLTKLLFWIHERRPFFFTISSTVGYKFQLVYEFKGNFLHENDQFWLKVKLLL